MSTPFVHTSIRLLVSSAIILGSYFALSKSVLAAPPPISNTSTGSFEATSSTATGTVTSNLTVTDVTGSPIITLVKRITAINGVAVTGFVDDPAPPDDTDPKWPDSDGVPNNNVNDYLRGAIACPTTGICPAPQPTQTIEYTIYFLSNGNTNATNVTICDLIPANTTFVSGAYNIVGGGSNLDIAFLNSTSLQIPPNAYLTGLSDSDRGNFYPPNTLPPTTCKKPTTNATLTASDNTNGLVVVDVAKKTASEILPLAISAGNPATSYGFMRFTVKVN
ncbi:MAG: DUF11 domain-containing protein [Pseudanabaena sp. CAN_BIN31]|nr:DUF11 domain-containing protein [Pseudanabaena sp. CAN_BIN31]